MLELCVTVCIWTLVQAAPAQTGTVRALLIGNDLYNQPKVFPPLRGTPQRDVEAVSDALRSAGVAKQNITILNNLDYEHFFAAIHAFRLKLSDGDSAIFYYSGHGFSIDDHAYLVPTDFKLESTRRAAESRSVSLEQVKRDLSKAQMRALIIDACRTNIPLLKQALGPRPSLSLANLYDSKPAGTGELIVFATQGGKPAIAEAPAEGLSYFTYYFVKRFGNTLPDLGTVVRQAQIATSMSSSHSQEPEVRDNLQGYLMFPISSSEPTTLPAASPRQIPAQVPGEPDFNTMLPLECPKEGGFAPSWQLGDNYQPYLDSNVKQVSFTAMGTSVRVPLNPVLARHIGNSETKIVGEMLGHVHTLLEEISSEIGLPESLRGPKGPVILKLKIKSLMREQRSIPAHLYVSYGSFLGSEEVKGDVAKIAIKDLSAATQDFVSHLDQESIQKAREACETAVQQLLKPTR